MYIIDRKSLETLIRVLKADGFEVIGPTLRDGAITYDSIESASQFPIGWTDRQEAGSYRLIRQDSPLLFGYAAGSHSWKHYLCPPVQKLGRFKRNETGFETMENDVENLKYAFIGVRSCDLQAISVQDKVFLEGPFADPIYKSRRENVFIVAVQCTNPGGTCFCASMGSGPKVSGSFDLALTEIHQGTRHYFVAAAGSERGNAVLRKIAHSPADSADVETAERLVQEAEAKMGRALDTADIQALLYQNLEHPRWEDVASRCLTCANCTMVCPTCFCTTVEETTDLTGAHAERRRRWDSCFTMDFSYIHGGYIRPSVKSRYRQWMTHKLASWIGQFGISGCVGCGRCITWCPVGIDITAEVNAISRDVAAHKQTRS
jgi:ferredoxin